MTTPTPECYFATDYHTARDRFRGTVSRAGGSLTALALTTRDPEGDTPTIDANSGFRIWSPTWGAPRPDS
ncbi:MAG TPA: hypothetical protein VGY48_31750 [Vicinamibacterales bacterium]|nr:hypothetical protein [Vicinamibacterales bacterium]